MTDTSAGIGLQKGRVSLTNALNNEGLMNNTFERKDPPYNHFMVS